MKVLLIWENVPESTDGYMLEGELAELAISCAGLYLIDGEFTKEELDRITRLYAALEGLPKLAIDKPITEPHDAVVVCGCIL